MGTSNASVKQSSLINVQLVSLPGVRGFNVGIVSANPAANAPIVLETTLPHRPKLLKGEIRLHASAEPENLYVGDVRAPMPERNDPNIQRWQRGIYFAQFYSLVCRQPLGQPGALFTKGRQGNSAVIREQPELTAIFRWYDHEKARASQDWTAPDYGSDKWLLGIVETDCDQACWLGMRLVWGS